MPCSQKAAVRRPIADFGNMWEAKSWARSENLPYLPIQSAENPLWSTERVLCSDLSVRANGSLVGHICSSTRPSFTHAHKECVQKSTTNDGRIILCAVVSNWIHNQGCKRKFSSQAYLEVMNWFLCTVELCWKVPTIRIMVHRFRSRAFNSTHCIVIKSWNPYCNISLWESTPTVDLQREWFKNKSTTNGYD